LSGTHRILSEQRFVICPLIVGMLPARCATMSPPKDIPDMERAVGAQQWPLTTTENNLSVSRRGEHATSVGSTMSHAQLRRDVHVQKASINTQSVLDVHC
jgi:hypothetical protein